MEERIALTEARRSCELRCPRSGVSLHDPVRVSEESEVVDRKYAMLQGWTIVGADEETRRLVEEHVARVKRSVVSSFVTPWRSWKLPSLGPLMGGA